MAGASSVSIWNDLKESAGKAVEAEDFATALADWEAALKESDNFADGDGRQVTSLEGLARTHYLRGEPGEAQFLYKRALVIREEQQGKEHNDVGSLQANLGILEFSQGNYKESKSHLEKALAIKKKSLGADHLQVGQITYFLALACHALESYDEADAHYRKSLDIKNKTLGNNHPDLINLLRNYADLLRKTSRDSIAGQMETFASGIEAKQKK